MNKKLRIASAKYLLAVASLLPVAHSAHAKSGFVYQGNTSSIVLSPIDLSLRGGFVYMLPNLAANSRLGKKEMTGFNGGAYLEFGGAYWGKFSNSKAEFHFEPVGRIECLAYNTCIYGINADYAAVEETGRHVLPQPIEAYPYESVVDFVATANVNCGVGLSGCILEVTGGLGMHADTKKQVDAVVCFGAGLGGRINEHVKIRAGYRARVNFFGNGTAKTSNAGVFHHNVELGLIYVFHNRKNFCKRQVINNERMCRIYR